MGVDVEDISRQWKIRSFVRFRTVQNVTQLQNVSLLTVAVLRIIANPSLRTSCHF